MKYLFPKLIFQKQNHEFTSAHKNSFGINPCKGEPQRSAAMISGHLKGWLCFPRILLLREEHFFLTFARKPNSFVNVVAAYFISPIILSNVDTLQSTPKLDKNEVLSNVPSACPTRDGSGPCRWNDLSLLKLPTTMPTLIAFSPLGDSFTLVPHSSFNILTCKNTSPNVNNFFNEP